MHELPPIYYIIFTAITALGVLLQAFVLLAIFIALRKSLSEFREIANETKSKVVPAIDSTKSLVEDISPKLKIAIVNLADVSHTLRQQANHVNETMEILLNRADVQIRRVDEMVTATFNTVDQASKALENVVAAPARRVTGVINGVRAGVEAFVGKKRHASTNGNAPSQAAAEDIAAKVPEEKPA